MLSINNHRHKYRPQPSLKYKNLITGAICSSGCAAVAVACYSAAGAVFGTVTAGVGTPAAILACNSAFGTCMASCAAALALPTP